MASNSPRIGVTDDRRPTTFFRPHLEALEDRYTPATVTTLKDSGAGSLRDAVAATASGGTVDFAVGLVGTITLTSQIEVNRSIKISGPGTSSTGTPLITVSGGGTSRLFLISNKAASVINVTIEKLLLTKGRATLAFGGAILMSNENLTLNSVTISNSSATGVGGGQGVGGGLFAGQSQAVGEPNGECQVTMNSVTFSGNQADRIGGAAYLGFDSTFSMEACTFAANKAKSGSGGGVLMDIRSTLAIEDSAFTGNTATGTTGVLAQGGGLWVPTNAVDAVTINRTQFSNNSSTDEGGGLYVQGGGSSIIDSCLFSNNTTGSSGGGAYFFQTATSIENSTFTGNKAAKSGGAIVVSGGSGLIEHSTIDTNFADTDSDGTGTGGGVESATVGAADLRHTIVANSKVGGAAAGDLAGTISVSFCLIENAKGATILGANNITGKDPLLSPLQNNGGSLNTMALKAGSPAINAGSPAFAGDPITDGRGTGFNRVIDGRLDIGAYEYQPPATTLKLISTLNPAHTTEAITYNATVTGTAKNSNIVSGVVDFLVDGVIVLSIPLVDSLAQLTTSFPSIGDRLVEARYNGFSGFTGSAATDEYKFDPSTASITQQVIPPEPPPPPPPPPNTPPSISNIVNTQVAAGASLGPITFTIGDPETPADQLVVTATTSNPLLVPTVTLGGAGASRTVSVIAAADVTGTATITITVSDGKDSIVDAFDVLVFIPPPPPPPAPPPPPPPLPPVVGLVAISAGVNGLPQVRVANADGSEKFNFSPFPGFRGVVHAATGDLNGDGIDDLVVAAGAGGGPHVRAFNGVNGAEIGSFFAFDPSFTGGVNLAIGDVTGDHIGEVIVGAGPSGAPHVRVFSTDTFVTGLPVELASFFAFDRRFRGGVSVAAGDTNGDGYDEIITGAGSGGGPHVKVFTGQTFEVLRSYFAYDPSFALGVNVAAGDLDGDGLADVVTTPMVGGAPHVQVFRGTDDVTLASFFAYEPEFRGGITASVNPLDDGRPVLVVAAGQGGGPLIRGFLNLGANELFSFFAFDPSFRGGAYVG